MRFKLGLSVGLATGYYLGAKAGRQRYDQINRTLRKVRRSEPVEVAAGKAKATISDGVTRVRQVVGARLGDGSESDNGGRNGHGDDASPAPPGRFL